MNHTARCTRGRKMAKPVFDIKDIPEESPSLEEKETENKSSSTTETTAMEAETETSKPEDGEGSKIDKEEVPEEEEEGEKVDFKVMFCKKKYDVSFGMDRTVGKLKEHLHEVIGVPPAMQKVMIKGLARDDQTLRTLGVTQGAKVLVVGSKLDDVLSVSAPTPEELAAGQSATKEKEAFSSLTVHRKVLDKGIPEDAMPGIKGVREPLPQVPLSGMLNKQGKKVRLTFKLELDQLWIGTQQRTDKIPMTSIKGVISEAIADHDQYHMMAIQLGTTEASRYWIYWVPAQYVDGIKDAILGKWQYF